MIIDCHVHIAACVGSSGWLSPRLFRSAGFRFLQWRFGLRKADRRAQERMAAALLGLLDEARELDAAVVLALDAVYREDGRLDRDATHMHVSNDYVIELARRHPKVLFGCSVHPCRRDAAAELERCIAAGAALLKWLPVSQCIDPRDPRCLPLYEILAHHRIPLLCHTGGEMSLPVHDKSLADPRILEPALQRGVIAIAAHCGKRSTPFDPDHVPSFLSLVERYENAYGDTAALNTAFGWSAFRRVLDHPVARHRLIHGSDWPILPMPPLGVGLDAWLHLMADRNWLRRDLHIKRALGFDDAHFHRLAGLLPPAVLRRAR